MINIKDKLNREYKNNTIKETMVISLRTSIKLTNIKLDQQKTEITFK